MVSYRRRRYYFRRRCYGRRYRRFRRYVRRFINGSSRSTIRMKCAQTVSFAAPSGHGTTLGSVVHLRPYESSLGALVTNPLYKAYRNLYEETKLIGMKVQLNVTSVVGNATLPSLEIYTAWDRRYGRGESDPLPSELKAMASSNVATALNNNVAKITRSIYASDLMEKAQWHDSEPRSSSDDTDDAWYVAAKNPNFFCPAFYFAFGSPSLAADTQVSYTCAVTYYVAFRNPKYGGSSSSKDLEVRTVTFPDDGDDMDPQPERRAVRRVDLSQEMARLDSLRYDPDDDDSAPGGLTRPTRSTGLDAAPSIKPSSKSIRMSQKNG